MELKKQLEVEEEDGDRQEEEEEVDSGETSQRECVMWMAVDDYECAQNLSHEVCGVITNCGRCAVRADSVHVRHASVEVPYVNVVIGVVLGELLVVVRVVPILLVML